jgi:phosphoglycolate phosphatase-like HAD superfamily hydrolase
VTDLCGENSLAGFKPAKEFFIGVDSDGCVFDTMELKHKECFAPMFIKHFQLQAVSGCAREIWEHVNLYSTTRGLNRFHGLSRALNLLRAHPAAIARQVKIYDTAPLDEWLRRDQILSNLTLREEVEHNRALEPVLAWSEAVNATVEEIVHDIPPFPYFRDSLMKMIQKADVVVVSQTPTEALQREWKSLGLAEHVRAIAGQELGSKSDHLRLAARGKYGCEKILMIGDAPGDFQAARANHALFYPIIPAREEQSWKFFCDDALDRFFNGQYTPEYESHLLSDFGKALVDDRGT